jgi:hypothetical protein
MKGSLKALVVATAVIAPIVASAQTPAPATRAQVQADLRAVESVDYNPANVSNYYPSDIQAAEAKLAERPLASSVGSDTGGSSDAGYRVPHSRVKSSMTYSH